MTITTTNDIHLTEAEDDDLAGYLDLLVRTSRRIGALTLIGGFPDNIAYLEGREQAVRDRILALAAPVEAES